MDENISQQELSSMDEISFEDIWNILVRRWLIIVLCTITAVVAGYLYYDRIVPLYRSTATLLVQVPSSSSGTSFDPMGNYSASEKWALTYAEMLRGEPVLKEASNRINYPTFTVEDLRKRLTVSVVPDTMLLKVSYDYVDAGYAQKIVNTINDIFIKKVNEMYESRLAESNKKLQDQIDQINHRISSLTEQQDNEGITQLEKRSLQDDIEYQYSIRAVLMDQLLKIELQEKQFAPTVKVYQEGTKSETPTNKNFMLIMAICLVLGLFVGVLLAFLFEYLDDTIKSENDLKRITDKRILGNIFYYNPLKEKKGYYYQHYKSYKKTEE